jgi:hypothetical protein
MGLTKGLRLVRGLRRQLGWDDRHRVAEAIREQLQLAGWRIEPVAASVAAVSSWAADNRDSASE